MRYASIVALGLAFVAACESRKAAPTTTTGSAGSNATAVRVVSLTPSATEVVAALGATKLLVGVDEFSTYPPEVSGLPKVGSFLQPNLEVIVKLSPSLVIVDDIHGQAAGALRDSGIPTIECSIHALPDVKKALRDVGGKLGKTAEANAVVDGIETALDAAAAKKPAKHPRVLAIIDREANGLGNLVAAGPGSWVDELLAVVGGDNVLAASGVRYPKVSLEEVLRGSPDVIIDLSFAGRGKTADWNEVDVPAVKNKRVHSLSEPYLMAPSPRVKDALDALANAIKM